MCRALRELFFRAACGNPTFSADDVHRWPRRDFDRLVGIGVLRETVQARYVTCDACTLAHREEVVWQRSVRTPNGLRAYIPCPVEMSVEVDPERLRQWIADHGALARATAAGLGLSELIEEKPGGIWRLGRRRVAGRFREFMLASRIGADTLKSAVNYSAPVVLALDGSAARNDCGVAVFALAEVASFDGERLIVDLDYIEDALPRERGAEKTKVLRSMPLPEGTSWSELAIEVGDAALVVAAGAITRKLTFGESGFADMRQGDKGGDRALQTLRLFAVKHGRFAPRKIARAGEEKTPFKKQVSVLRQRLKSLFPIEGEPIIFEKALGEYRCAFNVFLESDGGYPTPDGATWRDFRFEEMAGSRLRVGVTTRETYQAKTRSRESDRTSSVVAEREGRVWHEYPLERLGFTDDRGMPNPEGLALLDFLRGGGVLKRPGGDMPVLRLARRLREWTGLTDDPFRYDDARAHWIAEFECSAGSHVNRKR